MLLTLLCWLIVWINTCFIGSLFFPSAKGHSYREQFLGGLAILLLLLQALAFVTPLSFLAFPFFLLPLLWLIRIPELQVQVKDIRKDLQWRDLVVLLTLALVTTLPPWINDTGFYYTGTMQHLAQEGYSTGLANLNIRLGMASAWHHVPALGATWGEAVNRAMNINGLLLFFFYLRYKQDYPWLTAALLILGGTFISSPSPDLPVMLFSLILLLEYPLLNYWLIALLIAMLATTKATSAGILLVLLPLTNERKSSWKSLFLVGVPAVLLLAGKSLILSGHVLFPIASNWFQADYATPPEMLREFNLGVLAEVYHLGFNAVDYETSRLSQVELWGRLFTQKPYKVAFNLLVFISLLALVFHYLRKDGKRLFALALLGMGFFWLMSAPNYRFALVFPLLAAAVWNQLIPLSEKPLTFLYAGSLALVLFFNTTLKNQLNLVHCGPDEPLSSRMILQPAAYPEVPYVMKNMGSFEASVPDCLYCWNSPVPCYPDTVRTHNRKLGFELLKESGAWKFQKVNP